ncbi:MAG: glycosyltransferase family 4 protein [Candidatus Pacebacteria bacterium]|nr:glycosyltransferase family 4 protein [Candidatus Paceibacterota bacterium]
MNGRLLIVCQAVDEQHSNLGFFVRWIELFAREYEYVTVIANEVGTYTLPENVAVFSLGKEVGSSRLVRYARFISYILGFSSLYDRVFCHMNPEFVLAGAWWWRLSGKRIALWYVHGTVSARLRAALALVNAVCTTNVESFRIESPKVHRLGHGIDTDFFVPQERDDEPVLRMVSVSRIAPSKRIERIIAAAVALKQSGVPVSLSIIGGALTLAESAYEAEVRSTASQYPFVRFIGAVPHDRVRDSVGASDVFINVSTTGSMDKAVLEAMALGVVPLSTNPAFKALLEPHGLFVSDGTVAGLVAALQRLLARTDRETLVRTLREHIVLQHNLATLIPKIVTVLDGKRALHR